MTTNTPAPAMQEAVLTDDNVKLDINGATWLGMRVAGWTWDEDAFSPDQFPSENTMRHYASHWSTGPHNAERLYRESDIIALLSKLRAPVADERAAFEQWASNPVRAEKLPLDRWPKNDGYKDTRTYTAFYGWQARAALASAPVAGEAVAPRLDDQEIESIVQGLGMKWDGSRWALEDADLHPLVRALLYRYTDAPKEKSSAPDVNALMAAEYQRWIDWFHQGHDYDSFLKECVYAAPQASAPVAGKPVAWEDVRDALAMLLSGATGKASKHWIAPLEDATASGPLAKMRACLAAPQASEAVRDAALEACRLIVERFGPTEHDYIFSKRMAIQKCRAALSAQPGAQKEQSDGNQ